MDFVAIDFETANASRTSACSLGLSFVSNNKVTNTKYWLIKPEPLEFNEFNVAIHGITPEDVYEAPTFAQLWPEILPFLDGQIVVAHNASFDISVLRRTLELYSIPGPDIDFLCTYKISQKAFPSAGAYRLDVISKILDIELNHHQAESDAIACATILCKLMDANALNSLSEIEKFYGLYSGSWKHTDYYSPCGLRSARSCISSSKFDCSSIEAEYIDDDFNGKNFVFTGTLLSMPRSKAQEIVVKGSGNAQNGVTKDTDYLVLGLQDFRRLNGGTISSKMKKAYDMQANGHKIQIISEDDFISMIDDELYQLCFSI